MAITVFDVFLSNIENLEDAYFLDQAIRLKCDYGYYDCKENNGKLIISASHWPEDLLLANEKAIHKFLNDLEKRWAIDKGLSISASYDFEEANRKD